MTQEFTPHPSPFSLFQLWLKEATTSEPTDPDAACLATVDPEGLPNARVVLVRKVDEQGFCFFTNYNSSKGQEVISSGKAALNFHWKTRKRQVRARGLIAKVSKAESDSYYYSRPLGNRIGAWASAQSSPLEQKETLINRVKELELKYGDNPPRPDHWGGFRLTPTQIEFWQEGEFRLHDRILYVYQNGVWQQTRLYP